MNTQIRRLQEKLVETLNTSGVCYAAQGLILRELLVQIDTLCNQEIQKEMQQEMEVKNGDTSQEG